MADKIVKPFNNLSFVDFGSGDDSRYGIDFLRSVSELQVGTANNESNPKIMRANQSGLWLGQLMFIQSPTPEPVPTGTTLRFQVDMNGNVSATSFKTAFSGQRVRIINNRLESYDATSPNPRVVLDSGALTFYDTTGALMGTLIAVSPGTMILRGENQLGLSIGTLIYILLDLTTQSIQLDVPIRLAQLATDPGTAQNGTMYYNTATDEVRVFKAGSWRNVLTT